MTEGTSPWLPAEDPWTMSDHLFLVAISVNPIGSPPVIFLPTVTTAMEYGEQVIHMDKETYTDV